MKYIRYTIGIFVFSVGIAMMIDVLSFRDVGSIWSFLKVVFWSMYLIGYGLWLLDVPTINITTVDIHHIKGE